MRFIITINFLASKNRDLQFEVVGFKRNYGLRVDMINFVKDERKRVCDNFFPIVKVKVDHNQSIYGPKQRTLNIDVIIIIERLINCSQRKKKNVNKNRWFGCRQKECMQIVGLAHLFLFLAYVLSSFYKQCFFCIFFYLSFWN
jgi:hypothetical protein